MSNCYCTNTGVQSKSATGCVKKKAFKSVRNGSINISFGINKQAATFIATCDVRDNAKNVMDLQIVRADQRSCVHRQAARNSQPKKSHWRLGSRYCYRQTRRPCPCYSGGAQNTLECDQQSFQSDRARGKGCNSKTLGTVRFAG